MSTQTTNTEQPSQSAPKPGPRGGGRSFLKRLILVSLIAVAGLFTMSLTSTQPTNLGIQPNGQLAVCPDSPNCVSTQATDAEHLIPAINLDSVEQPTLDTIKQLISTEFPRARLVSESAEYLHYEFTSLIFRFVDDVEFLVDDENKRLHFRSASRVGYSDMGANRRRMEKISQRLADQSSPQTPDE